jgi:4-amino-4-deoxy-L-arabinose transferase-like glycosyltransferase
MKPSPVQKIQSFWEKYEFIIPLVLFILYLAFTLPGISWGAPDIWHPDEVVYISLAALHDPTYDFDSSNFNHPHLPIHAMLWLGKIILAFGQTDTVVLICARILSAVLVGLTIVLAYVIPRYMGYNAYVSGASGLLLLSVSEMTHNGHFAHNDTFVTFFSTLTIFFLIRYSSEKHRGWLYATFFSAGLALSCKYSAISLVFIPILYYLWTIRGQLRSDMLRILETLFISGALTYLGYAAGTPKALTWMAYYIKRAIPALIYNSNYGYQPGGVKGFLGQYAVFLDGVGLPLFLLFVAAFLWGWYKMFASWRTNSLNVEEKRLLLLLSILVIDLPIMASYNYPIRFFLPLMPLFAIVAALFVKDIYTLAKQYNSSIYTKLAGVALTGIVLFSLMRVVSVMSLFINDARIPATAYIASLPAGTTLEHTNYSPSIPVDHFKREHNYPLFFQKSPDQVPPTSKRYIFNEGETGLDKRETDYLVTDSFIYKRFSNPYICESMQAECEFFQQLETGQSAHYKLIAEFHYSLPPYLPQMSIDFVNPSIRIYERIP